MSEDINDIRAQRRKSIDFSCACRVADGPVVDLDLVDLSIRGFRAKMNVVPLALGQSVAIYPEGDEDFRGTVRGTDGEYAGVEFDRELPPPVYERLLHKHAPGADRGRG